MAMSVRSRQAAHSRHPPPRNRPASETTVLLALRLLDRGPLSDAVPLRRTSSSDEFSRQPSVLLPSSSVAAQRSGPLSSHNRGGSRRRIGDSPQPQPQAGQEVSSSDHRSRSVRHAASSATAQRRVASPLPASTRSDLVGPTPLVTGLPPTAAATAVSRAQTRCCDSLVCSGAWSHVRPPRPRAALLGLLGRLSSWIPGDRGERPGERHWTVRAVGAPSLLLPLPALTKPTAASAPSPLPLGLRRRC